ncbi:DivIVA domain-containing protein [Micromonospora fiedleri]|uniref:Cell wall synthesis protein Wag31 n=1 Tax=Micromonospora fiedleri TaxID=1157498 RepID=A0ABS1UTT8_9ACTN|nr:DivIVA domain-containing protein [Micromonospora fiedleri]MBL6278275.1 DivIVA domain-containing protein [Micromonospora fiedleri]
MIYASGDRLYPHQVRAATFDRRWRGWDPGQVEALLGRVADEMARLQREVVTANTEAERIRQALRQWQSRHNACRHPTDQPQGGR